MRVRAATVALLLLASTGCITAQERAERAQEAERVTDLYGSRTFDASSDQVREATRRALSTLGYEVVVDDTNVVATAPRVEARGSVGVGAAGESVGAGMTSETSLARSYEGRISPLESGQVKLTLTPRILANGIDVTDSELQRSREMEAKRFDEVLNQVQSHLEIIKNAGTQPATP